MVFDGSSNAYDRVPRMLALDKVGSQMDGNNALVILNRLGGNVSFRTATIGYFKGTMYNDSGGAYDFTFAGAHAILLFALRFAAHLRTDKIHATGSGVQPGMDEVLGAK